MDVTLLCIILTHLINILLLFICRQNIVPGDMKALVAFFETSQDMACIEDVLHMAIRSISHKSLLASFLDQINTVGGCHIFVNLLQRYTFLYI